MSTACPCGSIDTTILYQDSRTNSTMRTRHCGTCKTLFRTVEVVADTLPNLVNDNNRHVRERSAGTPISSIRLPLFGGLTP